MDSVVSVVPFKAQARDITFDFENSCNCCCFGWRSKQPTSKTQVYINSNGVAERFDHKKAIERSKSLRRGMTHLNTVIRTNAFLAEKEMYRVHLQISLAVGSPLSEDDPIPLTIDLIQRINTAIYEIFE